VSGGRDYRLLSQSITFALFGILIIWLVRYLGPEGVWNIGKAAIGLGFVIFIHELGHFLVAKWCDVHVETFSLGFGPAIPGLSFRRGETLYKVAWFPLGGYVKMVGEGAEGDEDDDDPRSFKNKSVWQRMAIISAGVIMNVILGVLCFIFVYMTHGEDRAPAEVGLVASGGPAWEKGLPTGAVIRRIGDIDNPYWEDLLFEVMLSSKGSQVPVVYELPSDPSNLVRITVEPRREKEDLKPIIGIAAPYSLKLPSKSRRDIPVARPGSPAAEADPPFEYEDTIVGTTDPDHPDRVLALPRDPRNPDKWQPDYFEFHRRLKLLAGKPMVIQVLRRGAGTDDTPVYLSVPAAFHRTFGMRMQMGPVAAVRDNSPAAKAGLQPRDDAHGTVGDIITQAEVSEANGQKTRWVFSGTLTQEPGVTVGYLDPAKLPYELTQWAKRTPGPKKVTLTVLRQVDHGSQRVPLVLDWDDHWKFDFDIPLYLSSPWAIPELGLAYRIKNFVEDVTKDSPAARAGLERNDLVKAIRFRVAASESDSSAAKWEELEPDQWANVFWLLQRPDLHDISIRVERAGQSLEMELSPEPDKSWPMVDRGLITQPEVRLQRASNLFEAVALGMQRTERIIMMIYLNLRAIATNRVSPKLVGGPISIARIAYESADQSIYQLILFLGMISVNLAVINFLPIPILDGGHMVFLIYEKLRGAPASESVRVIATYAGLAVIVGLMIFVFWVDIGRLF
jgi:regulator of sigma E protease